MFEALQDIVCWATVFVSLHFGTRVAWNCGSKCKHDESPQDKVHSLLKNLPVATALYAIGFLVISSYFVSDYLSRAVFSVTSGLILAVVVISIAMPEQKRRYRSEELVLTELTDGTVCRMAKRALNVFLANDRVVKFKRSDGWARVGVDPLRKMNNETFYTGVERRKKA